MAQENINYGSFPDDPAANTIRDAFIATQNNFDALFAGAANSNVSSIVAGTGITVNPANGVGNVTVNSTFNSLRVRSNTLSVSSLGGTLDGTTVIIPDANATLILELSSNTNSNSSLFNLTLAGNLAVNGNSITVPNASVTMANGNIILTNGVLQGNVAAIGGNGAIQFSDANGITTGTSVFYFDTSLSRVVTPSLSATQIIGGNSNITNGVFGNLDVGVANVTNLTVSNTLSGNTANFSNSVSAITFTGNLAGSLTNVGLSNRIVFYNTVGVSTGSANLTYNGTNLEFQNGTLLCANITGNLTGTASLATNVVGPVQSNISQVGNLNFLNVFGNAVVDSLSANVNVAGTFANFTNGLVANTLTLTNLEGSRANLQFTLTANNIVSNTIIQANGVQSNTVLAANYVGTPAVLFTSQTSDPASPVGGTVYFNSITGKLRLFNGLTWDNLN